MKTLKILGLFILLLLAKPALAHYLWIETAATGKQNQKQEVRVYFGEYTYGVIEEVAGDAFKGVSDFKLWLVDPSGKKMQLNTTAKEDHFAAAFTPTKPGAYLVYLENRNIDVLDYTEYDFGIFKPEYQAFQQVLVNTKTPVEVKKYTEGLVIKEVSNTADAVKLQVFYKGKPLTEAEATLSMLDLWTKKLTTDQSGLLNFKKPFDTKYILEVTHNEQVPGKFKGDAYEFIWHCATYCNF